MATRVRKPGERAAEYQRRKARAAELERAGMSKKDARLAAEGHARRSPTAVPMSTIRRERGGDLTAQAWAAKTRADQARIFGKVNKRSRVSGWGGKDPMAVLETTSPHETMRQLRRQAKAGRRISLFGVRDGGKNVAVTGADFHLAISVINQLMFFYDPRAGSPGSQTFRMIEAWGNANDYYSPAPVVAAVITVEAGS